MQLEMILPIKAFARYKSDDTLPTLPSDYRLRTYRPGDEKPYLSLMQRSGFGWSEKTLETTLNTMLPDGLFIIEHIPTAAIVASTVAGHCGSSYHPAGGELGWVGVDPEHRGQRLGLVVCDAVLRRFIAAGYRDIFLQTDEFRLPAIKTYLNLGFKPLMRTVELAERWAIVFANLGMSESDLAECAVETVCDDSAGDGYRAWRSAERVAPTQVGTVGEEMRLTEPVRIGFLPLYLALYDEHRPEMRKSLEAFRDRVLITLRDLTDPSQIEIIDVPVSTLRGDIDHASRAFHDAGIDLVATLHLAYSPSLLAADFLANIGVPILILDTTPSPVFDLENDTYLIENHAVHGVMDLTSVLRSKGVDFRIAAGHIDDKAYIDRLRAEIQGACMAKRFKHQTIGVTGAPFVGMGDFAIRAETLKYDWDIRVEELSPEMVAAASARVADDEIDRIVSEDAAKYDVSQIASEIHRGEVRSYLAIRQLCTEYGLSGYTMNFEHTGPDLPPPFYGVSRLMAESIGYAGESDVITACLGRVATAVPGKAMFSEIFCVDWTADEIMFSHMGEIDPRFAGDVRAALVEKEALGHDTASAYFRFAVSPMKVTLVNIGVTDGAPSRIVCAILDILERPLAPGVSAPHFFAKSDKPVREFLESYGKAGGGHHVYLFEGDLRTQLHIMCTHLGLGYEEAG